MIRPTRSIPLVMMVLAACATGRPAPAPTPIPDTGKRLVAEHGVVTSANPLASDAGLEMLRSGGNAVDAAVATAFALGVVEPQMSGLGGGGAMLIWRQAEHQAEFEDFYAAEYAPWFVGQPAPAAGTRERGLRVVGIPGDVAGLLAAHERYGKLSRDRVMAPAIRLAEQGFPVNQILAQMIRMDSAKLVRYPDAWAMFWPDNQPLVPGVILKNPELAGTLRAIAAGGRAAYYRGPVAERLVTVLNAGGHPARLADIASYQPRWRRPLCGEYRGRIVLSAPPPQTGSEIIHVLELLQPYDLPAMGYPTRSARAFAVLASAMRVGIADNRANGDPAWVPVPAVGITSTAFARERAPLVGPDTPPDTVRRADASAYDHTPPPAACRPYDPYGPTPVIPGSATPGSDHDAAEEPAGGETTHISVVDAQGNAVALTQTNSSTFGSGARVAGFFLNDSGYSFRGNSARAPSLSPWRIRTSTISPTILLRDGRVEMVVGAPGSGRIPTAIVQNMVYTLDYGMDPLEAVRMPRIFPAPAGRQVQIENGFEASLLRDIRALGYQPTALSFGYARIYMIVRRGDRWIGVADPRHDGQVRGY